MPNGSSNPMSDTPDHLRVPESHPSLQKPKTTMIEDPLNPGEMIEVDHKSRPVMKAHNTPNPLVQIVEDPLTLKLIVIDHEHKTIHYQGEETADAVIKAEYDRRATPLARQGEQEAFDEYQRRATPMTSVLQMTAEEAALLESRHFTIDPVPVQSMNPTLTDAVQQFATGAVRGSDTNHVRYDLISAIALRILAIVYAEGDTKYNPPNATYNSNENWRKGIPNESLLQHAMSHIEFYRTGDRSEQHLGHACWNLFTAIHQDVMEQARIELGKDCPEWEAILNIVDVEGRKIIAQARKARANREAAEAKVDLFYAHLNKSDKPFQEPPRPL